MQADEPVLLSVADGGDIIVEARFETPETARLLESARGLVAGTIGFGVAIGGYRILSRAFADRLDGAIVLGCALLLVAAYAIGQAAGNELFRRRFFLRRLTDARLRVRLSREIVVADTLSVDRSATLRFTAAPHRRARHEERAERVKGRLLSTTYREAWQVWLQHGERFVLLADVSSEDAAQAIARRLQSEDERVTRGAADHASYGQRQLPA